MRSQASAKSKESSKSSEGGEGEDIYIGQGKWVKDDPKKYPSKSQWAGGWAGGEEGLQKWLEEQEVRPCFGANMTACACESALFCGQCHIYILALARIWQPLDEDSVAICFVKSITLKAIALLVVKLLRKRLVVD